MFSWREPDKRLFSYCWVGADSCQPREGTRAAWTPGTGPILQWQWIISVSSPICSLDLEYLFSAPLISSAHAMSCISNRSVFQISLLLFFHFLIFFCFVKITNDFSWKELTKWGAVHPPFLTSSQESSLRPPSTFFMFIAPSHPILEEFPLWAPFCHLSRLSHCCGA